jgi:hypothetical protein
MEFVLYMHRERECMRKMERVDVGAQRRQMCVGSMCSKSVCTARYVMGERKGK